MKKGSSGGAKFNCAPFLAVPPLALFGAVFVFNDWQYLTFLQFTSIILLFLAACAASILILSSLRARSERFNSFLGNHGIFILIILLLVLVKYRAIVSSHFLPNTDILGQLFVDFGFMKLSISHFHQLPLWSPYLWSGYPAHAIPDKQIFYFFTPLLSIFSATLALNLTTLITAAIGALLMYALVFHLVKSEQASFVSAVIFTFSGFFIDKADYGFMFYTLPFSLMPAILLATIILCAQKDWGGYIRLGAIVGILLGLQMLGGTPEMFIYTSYFLLAGYLVFSFLTSPSFRKAILKVAVACGIIVLLTLAISAVKLLPSLKFLEMSNRAGAWPASNIAPVLTQGQNQLNIFRFLARSGIAHLGQFDDLYSEEEVAELGLIGFLLAIAAFAKIKKRSVLFLIAVCIISILLASHKPFYMLIRDNLPYFWRLRMPGRLLCMFVLAGSVLAGYGFTVLRGAVEKLKQGRIITWGLIVLLSIELIVLGYPMHPTSAHADDTLQQNHIMKHLGGLEGRFRVASFQAQGIDWGIQGVTIPFGLEFTQGLDSSIWIKDYFDYLGIGVGRNANLSRFWGMLNVKYVTSSELGEVAGFTLEQTFEECEVCNYPEPGDHFDGPYLYVNDNALPRAYTVDNALLIIGEGDAVQNVVYSLLAFPSFNPQTTAVIHDSRRIADVPRSELSAYKAIIPLTELSNSDLDTLRDMKDAGVKIMPDIFAGESGITEGQIKVLLEDMGRGDVIANEVDIPLYTPNRVVVGPVTEGSFLILAEKYSLFPGDWKAIVGEEPVRTLLRANAMATAIPLTKGRGETVTFKYQPMRFYIGAAASLIGLLAGIALIWQRWGRLKPKKKSDK